MGLPYLLNSRLAMCRLHFFAFHHGKFFRSVLSLGCPSAGTCMPMIWWKHVIHAPNTSVRINAAGRSR